MRLLSERAALREEAARLLDELGASAGEIAASLHSMRPQDSRWGGGEFSVSRYVHAVVGADCRVKSARVTKRWLVLKTDARWWSTIRVQLPPAVREFTETTNRSRPDASRDLPLEDNRT